MQLSDSIRYVFSQLRESLALLNRDQYIHPSRLLSNASIGQHVRHVAELFLCLLNGYETGIVNYEKRERDYRIETDLVFALDVLKLIDRLLDRQDKSLLLEVNCDLLSDTLQNINTNYYRELLYNLEHTIHHMALIRIGIEEVSDIILPEGFGVAPSTIKYRKACAQ